jgi:hypothetical protein
MRQRWFRPQGDDDHIHDRLHGSHQLGLRDTGHRSELASTSAVLDFASGALFPGYGIAQPIWAGSPTTDTARRSSP